MFFKVTQKQQHYKNKQGHLVPRHTALESAYRHYCCSCSKKLVKKGKN